jgi:hypothetical protein
VALAACGLADEEVAVFGYVQDSGEELKSKLPCGGTSISFMHWSLKGCIL